MAAILIAGILSWIFNFVRQWYTARAVGDVVLQLRQDAFAAVLTRDMSFYDENPSGKIVSRVTSDTEDFSTVVTLMLNLLSQVLLVVLITIVLFVINPTLALLALGIAPVIIIVALGLPAHRARHRAQLAAGAGAGQQHDSGDDQRHRRRQELPPGADDLQRVWRCQHRRRIRSTGGRASSSTASSRS